MAHSPAAAAGHPAPVRRRPAGLAAVQEAFAAAMAGRGDDAAAAALAAGEGPRSSTRLDIYRNNIGSALVRALEGIYPALVRLMGAEFFARLARDYARARPPRHGRLLEYGFDFPEFVAACEAAGRYPWFADVGRLELAWHPGLCRARGRGPCGRTISRPPPPERMADLVLVPHPSCQRLSSRYPVSVIWRVALDEEEPDKPLEIEGGAEWLLVVRPEAEVEVRTLTEPGFVFVGALAAGRTLGAAYEAARAADPGFDLQAHLAGLLAGATFTRFRLEPEARSEAGKGG